MQSEMTSGYVPEATPSPQPTTKRRLVFFDGDVTQDSTEQLRGELNLHYSEDPQAEVTLLINSVGGSMLHAMSLHSYVKLVLSGLRLNTMCMAAVGSAAVALFMLGRKRTMAAQSCMILHDARVPLEGREYATSELDWKVQQLGGIERQYAALISSADKDAPRASRLIELMKARTVLTPTEACQLGLATNVEGIASLPAPPAAAEA